MVVGDRKEPYNQALNGWSRIGRILLNMLLKKRKRSEEHFKKSQKTGSTAASN